MVPGPFCIVEACVMLRRIDYAVPDVEAVAAFYRDTLGMWQAEDGWGYGPQGARLRFGSGAASPHVASQGARYWKIGIALRDLDHAVAYLRDIGVPVSDPKQFQDIGYLAHLTDPAGHAIELIQVGFAGRAGDPGTGHPVGGQAVLAHLTLRVGDPARARAWCEDQLDLRCMSVQPVPSHDFTLYFYAQSDEALPDPDLCAVANREWLWARPYTLLELQHLETRQGGAFGTGDPQAAGPRAVVWEVDGTLVRLDFTKLSAQLG